MRQVPRVSTELCAFWSPPIVDVIFEANVIDTVAAYLYKITPLLFKFCELPIEQDTEFMSSMVSKHFPEYPIEFLPRPVRWLRWIADMEVINAV